MRIVARHRHADHELRLDGLGAETTVGEMLDAIAAHLGAELALASTATPAAIDGRRARRDVTLAEAGVVEGSLVDLDPATAVEPDTEGHAAVGSRWTLAVIGGPDAGRLHPLRPGRTVVGRSPDADIVVDHPAVDPFHLAVDVDDAVVTAGDLSAASGVRIDGQWLTEPVPVAPDAHLDLGPVVMALRAPPAATATVSATPTVAGRRPLARPARAQPADLDHGVTVPTAASAPMGPGPFGWASLLVPVAMAAVMAWLFEPLWALFALAGPVLMGATWLDDRRRRRRERRRGGRRAREALARVSRHVDGRCHVVRRRRRDAHPDPDLVGRRIARGETRLWERRLDHPDALRLAVGVGEPPARLLPVADGPADPEAVAVVAGARLGGVPIAVQLSVGGWVGVAGDRSRALAVTRWLITQLAAHHGPADVRLAVMAADGTADTWRWCRWLPHTMLGNRAGAAVAIGDRAIEAVSSELVAADVDAADTHDPVPEADRGPVRVCVIDGTHLTLRRRGPVRRMTDDRNSATAIVVADTVEALPRGCTTVVDVGDGRGTVTDLRDPTSAPSTIVPTGIAEERAERWARRLARFSDPEAADPGAEMPRDVALVDLLDLDDVTGPTIAGRWLTFDRTSLRAPVGTSPSGPVALDLVVDGPHALVGGTTGSGKSELLRTVVASLAATYPPDAVNFVLIDYKGGAAFDACAELPHCVGLVTDLDDQLGHRALRCLDAELRHRERRLRHLRRADLAGSDLARLVIVIDEFATLAAELPDFLDALVAVAQRGRSLGVHLILATQRPAGAVSPAIRTNTNLRVALRMLDPSDSIDVIDRPDAARLARDRPGRALARLGPGEVIAFQAARAGRRRPRTAPGVAVAPAWSALDPPGTPGDDVDAGADDLRHLVDAIADAHDTRGGLTPRRPWPDPLPHHLDRHELPTTTPSQPHREPTTTAPDRAGVPVGLADEPDAQRQVPDQWRPDVNAVVVGMRGSGTTTALATMVVALCAASSPDDTHIYVIDHDQGALGALGDLDHVGAVVRGGDGERQRRLLGHLDDLRRRRSDPAGGDTGTPPRVILVIDGVGAWTDDLDRRRDHRSLDRFDRLCTEGPAVGITVVAAGVTPGEISRRLATSTDQHWHLRLADPADHLAAGVGVAAVSGPPGRAIRVDDRRDVHFARPHPDGLAAAVADLHRRHVAPRRPPQPVDALPARVELSTLGPGETRANHLRLPIGVDDHDLGTVHLTVSAGDHLVVAGAAGSGRSTALATIGIAAVEAGAGVVVESSRPQLVAAVQTVAPGAVAAAGDELVAAVASLDSTDVGVVVLIDDADTIDDDHGVLAAAVTGATSLGACVIAAGRTDRLRGAYGHWLAAVSAHRRGVLLGADPLDGDLFGVTPPPPIAPPAPGRGWLIAGGAARAFQVAVADSARSCSPSASTAPGVPTRRG